MMNARAATRVNWTMPRFSPNATVAGVPRIPGNIVSTRPKIVKLRRSSLAVTFSPITSA